jgi:hypothetical protein
MKCREPAHSFKTVWYNALSAVTVSEENVDCEDESIILGLVHLRLSKDDFE